jgi:ribonucleoside-diphosphate reductase beta chain
MEFTRVHEAVNWNINEDSFTQGFWEQNTKQMWQDKELSPLEDVKAWRSMSGDEQEVYKMTLGGLTLLDTKQSTVGMPKIAEWIDGLQRQSVLSFMGMMEAIHAKSYSTIFTTLLVKEEINGVFSWVRENKYLQYKAEIITRLYESIFDDKSLYMALVGSVFLESFLFYSGFFYPLYLAGQAHGKMIHSGEIINLIIRDEAIHGLYVGILAQEVYARLSAEEQAQVDIEVIELLEDLMKNEMLYTEEVYSRISLDTEVKRFLRYNANKALMNLGRDTHYEHEDINPIVANGIANTTPTHDFFSTKGSGYQIGITEPLRDEDFIMNTECQFIIT